MKAILISLAVFGAAAPACAAPVGAYSGGTPSGLMTFGLDDTRVRRSDTSPVAVWRTAVVLRRDGGGPAAMGRVLDTRHCMLYTHGGAPHALICTALAPHLLRRVVYLRDYPAILESAGAPVLKCMAACQGVPARLRFSTQE